MKSTIFTFLLLVFYLFGFSQATHYSIPNAAQQPKWVMPLWFEDAIGQRDTIYFCYAPKIQYYGNPPNYNYNLYSFYSTQYGMNPIKRDSGKMVIGWTTLGDSIRKVVSGDIVTANSGKDTVLLARPNIGFRHVLLPLIMRWDPKVFYDDSLDFLPKKNGVSGPRGQGGWLYDPYATYINNCGWSEYALMTDTVQPFFNSSSSCINKDSMVFSVGLSSTTIIVFPWIGYVGTAGGINEIINNKWFKINPNPADDVLNIEFVTSFNEFSSFKIIDVLGEIKLSGKINMNGDHSISISDLPNDMYIFQLLKNDNTKIQSSKFIKQSN